MNNKKARKQWFRDRHRAPPDVDYKRVERANGLAQLARRNAIGGRRGVDAFGATWQERGSENQAGRMMVAARTADHLYAGSSLGGVWRGSPEGDDWEPLGDNLYGGAHWLAVFPPDSPGGPDAILAATDDGLVHRSADDGLTWTVPTGLPDAWAVRRLAVVGDGSHTALLLIRDANGDRHRVLRSTDRGQSWAEVADLGTFAGDLAVSRTGGSDVYLAGPDRRLRHSGDAGGSWTELAPLAGAGSIASVELAVSEVGPRFYAVARLQAGYTLFRSDDLGASWTAGRQIDDYWGVLATSTVDPDRVAWGGVEVHLSRDGAGSFEVVNAWSDYYEDPLNRLHADIMGIDVIPEPGGERWYVGTDGGLYESGDALDTVSNLSMRGLRVSQYYSTLTDSTDPTRVAAGAQDQGYQLTNGIAQAEQQWDFEQVLSGDYGHLTSSDGSHEWVYSVYPGFLLVQEGGSDPVLHYAEFPPDPRVAWLPRVVADPKKATGVFFPGSQLNYGEFDPASGEITWERWSDQSFSIDGYEYLAGLAFSPLEPRVAMAATSYGRMFRSKDRGRTWIESPSEGPGSHYFYGAAVVASITDAELGWVGGSGYGGPAVYRTRDAGRTWTDWGQGLPDTLVYCLCEAPDGSGALFAGSESSAWRRDPGPGERWVEITGAEAPSTIYWSCEALAQENTIRFATYGRGIWDYQLDPDGLGCFPPVDRDGDGVNCDTDCADDDPTIHPGASDGPCDGVDYDCNPGNELPPEQCPEAVAGCGCATGGAPSMGWLALVAFLWRRRPGD